MVEFTITGFLLSEELNMLKLLNRKDFRIVYLATILILCTALFAPPTALAKYGGDPADGVDRPGSKPDDSGQSPQNIALNDAETQTVGGQLFLLADSSVEFVVIMINIPGSVAPVLVKLSLPCGQDWGEQ